ncbi:MAG: helix-turn-helix transcriptional regulator [Defluviitaleaceae bacterium]|nr:helix-turn-helix transcriptional regulator [Defluviitaleaceae bacterium]
MKKTMKNEKSTREIFSLRVKEKMKLCGLSRKALSGKFGEENGIPNVPVDRINKWISPKGQMPKTLDLLVELAKILNTNIDYLCGLSEISTPDVLDAEIENQLGLSQDSIGALRMDYQFAKEGIHKKNMEHREFISLTKIRTLNALIEGRLGLGYGLLMDIAYFLLTPADDNTEVAFYAYTQPSNEDYANPDFKTAVDFHVTSQEDITYIYLSKIQRKLIALKKGLVIDAKDVEFLRLHKNLKDNMAKLNKQLYSELLREQGDTDNDNQN